jgi:hypothetical protein
MTCPRSLDLLQRRLDGESIADPPLDAHLRECAECRDRFAAAARLADGLSRMAPPSPPALFSARLVQRLAEEVRGLNRRRLMRRTVVAALAASVLVAVGIWHFVRWSSVPTGPGPIERDPVVHVDPPSMRIQDQVTEAGESVVAVFDRAFDQTRKVIPQMTGPELGDPLPSLETPAQALREAGQGVSAGLEPVAASARRAVGLFMHNLMPTGSDDRPGL